MGDWSDIWRDWYKWTAIDEAYAWAKRFLLGSFAMSLLASASQHWLIAGICIGVFVTNFVGIVWFWLALRKHARQQVVPNQTHAVPTPTALAADFIRQFDNPFIINAENAIRGQASNYAAGTERETHLVRAYANTVYTSFFELAYAGSFGSQLKLLRLLSDHPNGVSITEAREFYEEGSAQVPQAYVNRPFQLWFDWLLSGQLVSQQGEIVKLEPFGKELLKFLVDRNYSVNDRLG
jgi:hypothetical protein